MEGFCWAGLNHYGGLQPVDKLITWKNFPNDFGASK